MLKELSVKEALLLLAEKYPEPVEGWFWDENKDEKGKGFMNVCTNAEDKFVRKYCDIYYKRFAIEVSNEYRYMTQQECLDWVCLNAVGHQIKLENEDWRNPFQIVFNFHSISKLRYRTIQEIDGKIVYGEPMEFKVKV